MYYIKYIESQGNAMKSLEEMKIYIIDDDINSIQLIQTILKKKGYQCIKDFTSPTEGPPGPGHP